MKSAVHHLVVVCGTDASLCRLVNVTLGSGVQSVAAAEATRLHRFTASFSIASPDSRKLNLMCKFRPFGCFWGLCHHRLLPVQLFTSLLIFPPYSLLVAKGSQTVVRHKGSVSPVNLVSWPVASFIAPPHVTLESSILSSLSLSLWGSNRSAFPRAADKSTRERDQAHLARSDLSSCQMCTSVLAGFSFTWRSLPTCECADSRAQTLHFIQMSHILSVLPSELKMTGYHGVCAVCSTCWCATWIIKRHCINYVAHRKIERPARQQTILRNRSRSKNKWDKQINITWFDFFVCIRQVSHASPCDLRRHCEHHQVGGVVCFWSPQVSIVTASPRGQPHEVDDSASVLKNLYLLQIHLIYLKWKWWISELVDCTF